VIPVDENTKPIMLHFRKWVPDHLLGEPWGLGREAVTALLGERGKYDPQELSEKVMNLLIEGRTMREIALELQVEVGAVRKVVRLCINGEDRREWRMRVSQERLANRLRKVPEKYFAAGKIEALLGAGAYRLVNRLPPPGGDEASVAAWAKYLGYDLDKRTMRDTFLRVKKTRSG
jgi:hypothetical protein